MARTLVPSNFYPLGGTDSDGDGMSDDFENFYGVNDPSADPDGDGMTNLQEFQAGINPVDPSSNLRIRLVTRSGNDFAVTFSLAVTGKTYRLERKDALSDQFWIRSMASPTSHQTRPVRRDN